MRGLSDLELAKKVVEVWEEKGVSPQEALEEIKEKYGVE